MSDLAILDFVDADEIANQYRVVLWAAPGEGKSVGATTAPDPILALSADRPTAYQFARRHHHGKDIREVRYTDASTLAHIFKYLQTDEGRQIRTVIIDPFAGIYDRLVDTAPRRPDGDPDYQSVNKKILGFLYSLRQFQVNVVIVAHERLNDGKKGDGKLYPALGGPSLLNKVLAESDIVAHVERESGEGGPRWFGQIAPRDNLVCKDATVSGLGERRPLDLTEWFVAAAPDDSDVPFGLNAPADDGPDKDAAGDVETINGKPVDGPPEAREGMLL